MWLLTATSAVLALCLAFAGTTARAFDLAAIPSRPPTGIDSLRADAEVARLSLDWERADARRQALLARAPGDPFAIREIALEAMDRGLMAALAEALHGTGTSPIPLPQLSPRDRRMLEGYVAFYRGWNRSAAASFDAALALHEDGWAHFYRARSGIEFPEPRPSWERHLDAALKDSDVWPMLANWILSDDVFESDKVRRAEDGLFAAMRDIPWTDHVIDQEALNKVLQPGHVTAEDVDRMWRAGYAKHGIHVANWIPGIGYMLNLCLPPPQTISLLERFEAGAPPGIAQRWRLRRAVLLEALGWDQAADSLVAQTPLANSTVLGLRLKMGLNTETSVEIARAALRLSDETLGETATAAWALDLVGHTREADSLRQLEAREAPDHLLRARLYSNLAGGWNRAKGLLDSLEAAGYSPGPIRSYRLRMAEQHGDTSAYQEAMASRPAEFLAYLREALAAAYGRGINERQDRLFTQYRELAWNDPFELAWMGKRALDVRRLDHLKTMLLRLGEICPGCPLLDEPTVTWYTALGHEGRARPWIRSRAADRRNTPQDWANLSMKARSVGERELSDSLFAAAERAAPRNRFVRMVGARRRLMAGDLAGGKRILAEILTEVPGDRRVIELHDYAVAREGDR